ncbi:hypothetical protein D7X48_20165 [bacterium D16-50]|nr:hypothetical protein D7X48_20165 [bacterium D16-50]
MGYKELFITNIPAISAVYFSLLQCKYDFYPIEREAVLKDKLRSFIVSDCGEYDFFFDVKQNTCEVYPYWPRAAMLETATFYIDLHQERRARSWMMQFLKKRICLSNCMMWTSGYQHCMAA